MQKMRDPTDWRKEGSTHILSDRPHGVKFLSQTALAPNWHKDVLNEFTPITKGTLALLGPIALWCGRRLRQNKPLNDTTIQLLIWYSQAVCIYAMRNMYIHMVKNIGVKRTFTRSFERFSFLGALIYTASLSRSAKGPFGRTYFLFNLLYTLISGFFVWSSLMYNRGLPHPSQKREYPLYGR